MQRFRNIWRKTLKAGHSSSITDPAKPNSIIPWLKDYSHNLFQSKHGLSDHTARRWHWLQSLQLFGQRPLPKFSSADNSHAIPIATSAAASSSEVGTLGWKAKLTPDLQYDLTAAFRAGSPSPIPDLCPNGELGGPSGVVTSSAVHGSMRHPKKAKQQAVGRVGQMKKTPLPRSIVQVLDTGMRPGMMPQTHGPVSSSYGDAANLEQLNKLWKRRGLGRNKVLPGATWSLRRLKLDRAEASKLERHHRATAAANEHPATLNGFAPLARVGMAADAFSDSGVLARILAGHHDAPLAAKLLEWAKQQHWYTADTRTYAELIRIMAWAGEADAAEELLQEMHFLAGSPDGETFLVVLLVFSRMGRLSDAIRLLGDALKLGHRLDRKIVKVIIYLSLKSGSPSDKTLLLQTLSLNRHLVGPSDCFENRLRELQSPSENAGSTHVQ